MFLFGPDSLWAVDFLELELLLAIRRVVDSSGDNGARGRLEGRKQKHEVFGADVHPVIIAQCESFRDWDILVFDNIFVVIGPNPLFLLSQKFVELFVADVV